MCLNPIRIKNPKHEISLAGGIPYYITVPCGECAECKKLKQNEWYFRSYYEAKSTFDSGGYVMFDTLTYRDEELPHISEFVNIDSKFDHSCFDVEDYRNFIAQLREEWHRLYVKGYVKGDSSHNLKYFLTSEYGTSETGTHRPHYHVLFFVKNNAIDPLMLSKLINKCWHRGRTDGIDYHPYHYVMKHVFSYKFNSDQLHLQQVCMYVSKYITKDSHFQEVVNRRLYVLYKQKYLDSGFVIDGDMSIDDFLFYLGEDEKDRYKKLKKNVNQFHRQSQGFGEDFLKYNNYDDIYETGMISMPDKHNIVKHIPIPSYYQMKIWYDLVKTEDGKAVRWELNEEGKKYKFKSICKTVDMMADKIEDWRNNMLAHNYFCDEDESWYDKIISEFDELNDGRDLRQFTMYLLFYKGRIKTPEWYNSTLEGNPEAIDPFEFWMIPHDPLLQYQKQMEASFVYQGRPILYGYNHSSYKKIFGTKFVSFKDLGTVVEWNEGDMSSEVALWNSYAGIFKVSNGFTPSLLFNKKIAKSYGAMNSEGMFIYNLVVKDTDDPTFKNYDRMWSLYVEGQKYKNNFKQKAHDEKEDVKYRLSRFTKRSI